MKPRPKTKYSATSLPLEILKQIDLLINELGYWPSRGAFVREACLEKIRRERQTLEKLREANQSPLRKGQNGKEGFEFKKSLEGFEG